MSQSKQKLLVQGQGLALAATDDHLHDDKVTYEPATNVLWPQWVINEMTVAIYKSRWEGYNDIPLFATLGDEQRKPYVDMCRGALKWIEAQGWVKLGK